MVVNINPNYIIGPWSFYFRKTTKFPHWMAPSIKPSASKLENNSSFILLPIEIYLILKELNLT